MVAPVAAAAVGALLTAACSSPAPASTIGDAEVGRTLIAQEGCGACHRIPGVEGADGLVGPPLDQMGDRMFIGGSAANTPDNMVRWLMDPQAVDPGTAMPDLGIDEQDARNIAAYLDGLR